MIADRVGFLGVCHACGGPSPGAPYCTPACRAAARAAVDAGTVRALPEPWVAAARAHGNRLRSTEGVSERTKQRRRRAAGTTT